jgi:hypothetical protein
MAEPEELRCLPLDTEAISMETAEHETLAPKTALELLGAAESMQRLQALDDVWTAYTEQADLPGSLERDHEALSELVAEMLAHLARLPREVTLVRAELSALDDEQIDEALNTALGASSLSPEQAREILGTVLVDYSLRGAIITACDYVAQTTPLALSELTNKMSLIQMRALQRGDLPPGIKCALYLTIAGAGLGAAIAGSGGTVIAIAAVGNVVGGSIWGFKSSGCPDFWADITGELRG